VLGRRYLVLAYVVAFAVGQLLAPSFEPVRLREGVKE
jgi:hypothetical protein